MTTKCNKVKNPCKICLQNVSNKTGVRCQGKCRKWVHFACLNYTPGKIKDIKAGIIKVTCPCPDCMTRSYPKEYRTDEPFSCDNIQCPSNLPPQCTNDGCPSSHTNGTSTSTLPPLLQCDKKSCKKHSHPHVNQGNSSSSLQTRRSGFASPQYAPTSCLTLQDNSQSCRTSNYVAGDSQGSNILPSMSTVEQMCNTVGQLTNQINDLMCKMKQVVQERGGSKKSKRKSCDKPETKTECPKPCFCARNPHK